MAALPLATWEKDLVRARLDFLERAARFVPPADGQPARLCYIGHAMMETVEDILVR